MGWKLIVHSFRLLFNNLNAALRVSLVLYAVYAVLGIIQQLRYGSQMVGMQMGHMPSGSFWLFMLVAMVAYVVLFTWIAIAWHRFVLLGELPSGWIPAWPGEALPGYVWRSVLIVLLLVVVMIPVGFVLGFVITATGPWIGTFIMSLGSALVGAVIFYRLASILPAVALGKPIGMKQAWEATRGQTGAIVLMTILIALGSLIASLPSVFNPDPNSIINLAYSFVLGWFLMLIGISILTTIYGHFIEGRAID